MRRFGNVQRLEDKKWNLSYLADDRGICEFNGSNKKQRDKQFPASVTRE
jgi:hypothetical protein